MDAAVPRQPASTPPDPAEETTSAGRTMVSAALDALPFAPGIGILGVIFGASAGSAGIGPVAAVVMSAIVWSGAAQFAALPLWREGAGVVAITALVLSLRFSLMSASLAEPLARAGLSRAARVLLAVTVTDETYALAITRGVGRLSWAYLFGAWLPLYTPWLAGTIVGVLVGVAVPDAWRSLLEAVFPIVFLTLTVLVCTAPAYAVVAMLGGLLSVAASTVFPPGWSVIVAGVAASLAGPPIERRLGRGSRASFPGPEAVP